MKASYKKLWKLLVDKEMSKGDLHKASGLSSSTMTKLRKYLQLKNQGLGASPTTRAAKETVEPPGSQSYNANTS